jgi:D-3-phosphoglycerate dehydrogenase / 2-oxoglutarate reductase
VEQTSLSQLLALSDYVVCLTAVTADTENIINAKTFGAMKQGSFLMNAARGNLLDDHALVAALDSGHLAGAAIHAGLLMLPVQLA